MTAEQLPISHSTQFHESVQQPQNQAVSDMVTMVFRYHRTVCVPMFLHCHNLQNVLCEVVNDYVDGIQSGYHKPKVHQS